MSVISAIHENFVFDRRIRVLSGVLADLLPNSATILDVGCGDGNVAQLIMDRRPDVSCEGIDVLVRPLTKIPVHKFDGSTIPFSNDSFDVVMFVDVLHHTEDLMRLLSEARRVARSHVIIKDHCRDGLLAGATLRVMDWVGNARHGVALPYNYWPEVRWREAFDKLELHSEQWLPKLGLYPFPFSMAFDRNLHFATRLRVPANG